MKKLVHILGCSGVVLATILGIFFVPFLMWLFSSELIYLVPFCASIVLFLLAILWLIIRRRKADNKTGKYRPIILLYVSLAMMFPNTIALIRFNGNSVNTIENCFYYNNRDLYSRFGLLKNDDYIDDYVNTTDKYGNRYIAGYKKSCNNYNYIYNIYQIVILDENGNYVETFSPSENSGSDVHKILRRYGYR